MLLAIDIGNSDITLGIWLEKSAGDETQWNTVWRIPTVADLPQMYYSMRIANNFLEIGLRQEVVRQVVISSVVPALTSKLTEAATRPFRPGTVGVGSRDI